MTSRPVLTTATLDELIAELTTNETAALPQEVRKLRAESICRHIERIPGGLRALDAWARGAL